MLASLQIDGLAIVHHAEIDFDPGLNIITGETGTGKSILVKALGLILGSKADASMIRSDQDQATVTAEFLPPDKCSVWHTLREAGLSQDTTDSALLIRRTIFRNGRTKAWINDQPVTLTTVKEVGEQLLDLFSQHESHEMLSPKKHLEYLDHFLPDQNILSEFGQLYRNILSKLRKIEDQVMTFAKLKAEEDYLSFRCKEFQKLEPSLEDFENLYQELEDLEDSRKEQELLQKIQSTLEEAAPLEDLLQNLCHLIHQLAEQRERYKDLDQISENCLTTFNELSYTISRLHSHSDSDLPHAVEQLQGRLSDYKDLMRKTNSDSITSLIDKMNTLYSELESIGQLEDQLTTEIRALNEMVHQAKLLAQKLHQEREKTAKTVIASMEKELKTLVMPNARVRLEFAEVVTTIDFPDFSPLKPTDRNTLTEIAEILTQINGRGQDQVQFMLSANPGETLRPLQKVVSGGELSRIMLALKKALAVGANTCVLVFDEIDTGISGKIADVVGQKLRELSRQFQIVCISHLPQVAVYGNTHFQVSKTQSKSRTETRFVKLNEKEREHEIARLLSGPDITKASLNNAKTLLQRSR